jgi:hypothetical protein
MFEEAITPLVYQEPNELRHASSPLEQIACHSSCVLMISSGS